MEIRFLSRKEISEELFIILLESIKPEEKTDKISALINCVHLD